MEHPDVLQQLAVYVLISVENALHHLAVLVVLVVQELVVQELVVQELAVQEEQEQEEQQED
jgi:hypothetical protein